MDYGDTLWTFRETKTGFIPASVTYIDDDIEYKGNIRVMYEGSALSREKDRFSHNKADVPNLFLLYKILEL
jgi:hypothetical protein